MKAVGYNLTSSCPLTVFITSCPTLPYTRPKVQDSIVSEKIINLFIPTVKQNQPIRIHFILLNVYLPLPIIIKKKLYPTFHYLLVFLLFNFCSLSYLFVIFFFVFLSVVRFFFSHYQHFSITSFVKETKKGIFILIPIFFKPFIFIYYFSHLLSKISIFFSPGP